MKVTLEITPDSIIIRTNDEAIDAVGQSTCREFAAACIAWSLERLANELSKSLAFTRASTSGEPIEPTDRIVLDD